MKITVKGARENNLKNISIEIGGGLTVVTGISGSGKTSLVFDTIYHEAHRRFMEIYTLSSSRQLSPPARVDEILGLGPAIAIRQNTLNRNPLSTLATASGLHPFLRLLYARYGSRHCPACGYPISILSEDEIVEHLSQLPVDQITLSVYLLRGVAGSHATLLALLHQSFPDRLLVDGYRWDGQALAPTQPHDIQIILYAARPHHQNRTVSPRIWAREMLQFAASLGTHSIFVKQSEHTNTLTWVPVCAQCAAWFEPLEPVWFHTQCQDCAGKGCSRCLGSGLHPQAAATTWQGLRLDEFLALDVDQALERFSHGELPSSARRLVTEIFNRLAALQAVGLGYLNLNRPSPSVSRGEAQRIRMAVALTSRLEDMLHILDEPTIGQHPLDVRRLLEAFRNLPGPVIYVEHDRIAAAEADQALDLGPGAGSEGGSLIFSGTPAALWETTSPTGEYFSLRKRVIIPHTRPAPQEFLTVYDAHLRNLQHIDVSIPIGRLTVLCGVSGSGKSTLVEDVLAASLEQGHPVGCAAIHGWKHPPVVVDQSPIGTNPRSNPATYTKLADIIRDFYASQTGLSPSHFSFNRSVGACPECNGMGALEVQLRFLPSTWIPCEACAGLRFSEEVLAAGVNFNGQNLNIAEFYHLPIQEAAQLLLGDSRLSGGKQIDARNILGSLRDVGLGYLTLGQPSPTLSGGEAQRVKLTKYLARKSLAGNLLILDEPSTGLHPHDIHGLLVVLDRLVRRGATILVVEHNTDILRAADWVIELGPGCGPQGGQLLYSGSLQDFVNSATPTSQALARESTLQPTRSSPEPTQSQAATSITVRGARANNLQNVAVDFPKGAITVVTGLSGSGKSSLVSEVLENEARRRFLESLSMYERQSTREGPEAPVDSVSGLGVTLTIGSERLVYQRRATVGSATEISNHLAVVLAELGQRDCPLCGRELQREKTWRCPGCGFMAPLPEPRHFSTRVYAAACQNCHGVGSRQAPEPAKLIIYPEKPLLSGAMYSPGFFPQGYLGKPFNGGHYQVLALAARYQFDPFQTPWNEMSSAARQAFLYGDPEPLQVTYHSRNGRTHSRLEPFPGFYGWIRDWDVGGTYTRTAACQDCSGSGLRPDYASVHLSNYRTLDLTEMPLSGLLEVLRSIQTRQPDAAQTSSLLPLVQHNLNTACARLSFLAQVGLGYLSLNRPAGTLSAGEAQRIRLASLLGSGLTALTVLLDEPTRGLHPGEVDALIQAMLALRDGGNTLIVVEHDVQVMRAADWLVDMGPAAGWQGGRVVAQGTLALVASAQTITAAWLRGERRINMEDSNRVVCPSTRCLTIRGARANNLKGEVITIPLGCVTGICGVSGSGKSTLVMDTLGRALAPKKQTTSVAYEPIQPGEYDAIDGAPKRVILVDQVKAGIGSPAVFLGLTALIAEYFADGEQAQSLGLNGETLTRRCSACGGRGYQSLDMGFLPAVHSPCETCRGTGLLPEAWEARRNGLALPDAYGLTIDQGLNFFENADRILQPLTAARDCGLGYLVLRQPDFSLSGGEAQRLKIVRELIQKSGTETLYILDEPTVGQHLEDVSRLVIVLNRLTQAGHSVLVVEHHPHLLACCDWLIELGPVGGPQGGWVIASGTPRQVAAGTTPTAKYLLQVFQEVG